MRYKKEGDEDSSISIDLVELHKRGSSNLDESPHSFFRPQPEPTPSSGVVQSPSGVVGSSTVQAPEKKLTLFALHLAILEKLASGIGTLTFIWATVVLLGGFAVTLQTIDFWFVTIILLGEGTRIYSRSHELEWQHHATWTLGTSAAAAGVRRSFRAIISSSHFLVQAIKVAIHPVSIIQRDEGRGVDGSRRLDNQPATAKEAEGQVVRTWHAPDVPLLPYIGWVFVSRHVSRVLVWLQLSSAVACVVLSLSRLIDQGYGEVVGNDTRNRKPSLNVFYGGALAEALMFLMEKAYFTWRISHRKLLEKVSRECDLGTAGIVSIRRFFYDSYSKCIEGSIFDGLRMDLVMFAKELLDSDFRDEQLMGAQILHKFANNDRFAYDTLRKIESSTWVIERLIEMLNWKNPAEEEIRKCAAHIVSKLAGKKQNSLRVAGIPGAIESISSLLYTGRIADETDYEFWVFNLLGLLILKELAHEHDNCFKIGNTRGLLSKVIDLTRTNKSFLRNNLAPESQIKAVKSSLKVVKRLVRTTGNTGKMLRQEISEIVFTVSNIREIIQHGESHMVLQKLGIEILSSLAMDDNAKEMIGGTGGIIKLLVSTFFKPGFTDEESSVSNDAGEAMAMLALESKTNCSRMLKEPRLLEQLIDALQNRNLQINASRILHNLCAYSSTECYEQLAGVTVAIPNLLSTMMTAKEKLLEVSIGLTTQICKFMSSDAFAEALEQAKIKDNELVEKLVNILKEYSYPDIKVPRIRRFVIEQAIWMMKSDREYIQWFKDYGIELMLESVSYTTSELECFHVFSGSVGISRHSKTLSSIVDTAMELVANGQV